MAATEKNQKVPSNVGVVGWASRLEWVQIYDELYSDDIILQKHAVNRIAVWKCRLGNRLQAAIECTWTLISAEIQHKRAVADRTLNHMELSVRMAYSIAITRFINLMTGESQDKFLVPVHIMAEEIGLPQWMVDLRHNATHSVLPSLATLRTAAKTSLNWLKAEYWEVQLSEIDPSIEQPFTKGMRSTAIIKLAQKLEQYMQEQFKYLSKIEEYKRCRTTGTRESLEPILKSLKKHLTSDNKVVVRMALLSVALEDGYMILTQEQMEAYKLDVEDLLRSQDLQLPWPIIEMWIPFIEVIHKVNCTSLLLQALVTQDTNCAPLRQYQLMAWIALIVSSHTGDTREEIPSTLCQLYKDSNVRIKGPNIMSAYLKKPNCYTGALLPRLFPFINPPLSDQQQSRLVRLVNTYTGQFMPPGGQCEDEDAEPDQIYRLDSVNRETLEQSWSDCPMGYCPGYPVDFTSLELPESVDELGQEGAELTWEHSHSGSGDSSQLIDKNLHNDTKRNETSPKRDTTVPTQSDGNNMEWTSSQLDTVAKVITIF